MVKLELYDTTLRDGAQYEGISLSVNDKLVITKKLDTLGVDYIEGGWPGSNPKDAEFFERARTLKLHHAQLAAFGSTRRSKGTAAQDANIQALLDARTPVVTLVGKAWDLHVTEVLGTSLEENLAMIYDSVGYLKSWGRRVFLMPSISSMALGPTALTPSRLSGALPKPAQTRWSFAILMAALCPAVSPKPSG